MKKTTQKNQQDKNLCTVKLKITKQTRHHLRRMAAMAGYGERDLGRVVDKMTRNNCASMELELEMEKKRGNKNGSFTNY